MDSVVDTRYACQSKCIMSYIRGQCTKCSRLILFFLYDYDYDYEYE